MDRDICNEAGTHVVPQFLSGNVDIDPSEFVPYPGGNDRKYKDNGNCETID